MAEAEIKSSGRPNPGEGPKLPADLRTDQPGTAATLADFLDGGGLSIAEAKLLDACRRGEECIVGDGTRPEVRTRDNEIRASFLRYLILGGCRAVRIHQRGVHLVGAYVCASPSAYGAGLDLEATRIKKDVFLVFCKIEGGIWLARARTGTIYLNGSSVGAIEADGLVSTGSLVLRDHFQAFGSVRLVGATLGGDLDCTDSLFEASPVALHGDGLLVKGAVFLRGQFCAVGTVRLIGARIHGYLDCAGGYFGNEGTALDAAGMGVGGAVLACERFHARGPVVFRDSNIEGGLDCRNGQIDGDLTAGNLSVGGNLWLSSSFLARGTIAIANAKIGGNLHCDGSIFLSKDQAILANRAEIGGDVILGSVNSAGTFQFQNSVIKGNFSAQGATLSSRPCLELRDSTIEGNLVWRDVNHAGGRLGLGGVSAKVLNIDLKSWEKPDEVKINNFSYLGFTDLESGTDTRYWKRFLAMQPLSDRTNKFRPRPYEQLASVLHASGYEEEALNIRIEKETMLTQFVARHRQSESTGIRLVHEGDVFWRRLKGWITDHGYRPGKALIFLALLILSGWLLYFGAAVKGVMAPTHPLIFKEAKRDGSGAIPFHCSLNWVYFLEAGADDPSRPEAAAQGSCKSAMPSEYSEFSPLLYSADIILPIINLRQQDDWAPRVVDVTGERDWFGFALRAIEWVFIILGWALSLLFVSAVSGMIRR